MFEFLADVAGDPIGVLTRSYYRCVRYHMGSLAVGSFIVALVKAAQFVLAYISQQVQVMRE